MGLRLWRRFKIMPGITLNLSKGGVSTSFGGKGAHMTMGRHGIRQTVGLPGTGLYYTKKTGVGQGKQEAEEAEPEYTPADALAVPRWRRLFMGQDEKTWLDGCAWMLDGCPEDALDILQESTHPDNTILAGFLLLGEDRYEDAIPMLMAARRGQELNFFFSKYGVDIGFQLPITDWYSVQARVGTRAIDLALAKCYQATGQYAVSRETCEDLLDEDPEDEDAKLLYANILMAGNPDAEDLDHVIQLAAGTTYLDVAGSTMLLCRARALRLMGKVKAAEHVCREAARRPAKKPEELLTALRFERALCWGALDSVASKRKAVAELQCLWAEDPDNQEVQKALSDLERG